MAEDFKNAPKLLFALLSELYSIFHNEGKLRIDFSPEGREATVLAATSSFSYTRKHSSILLLSRSQGVSNRSYTSYATRTIFTDRDSYADYIKPYLSSFILIYGIRFYVYG